MGTSRIAVVIFCFGASLPFIGVRAAENLPASQMSTCKIPDGGKASGTYLLKADCIYQGGIRINASNTTLDCNGGVLDGQGITPVGVYIKGKKLKSIVVKNCEIRNFKNTGVMVAVGIPGHKMSKDISENYKIAPSRINLQNLKIYNIAGNGVHFNGYVKDASLSDSEIHDVAKVAVYLSQATQEITIKNNYFYGNGGVGKQKGMREAIAIDSSAKNVISGNVFSRNAAGSIFLYKNCGEKFSSGTSVLRWQSSNDNTITENTFKNEKIGIWIASRQSRDLKTWDCGDTPVDSQRRYYQDYANHNLVKGNRFCGVETAIRVEGDDNEISNNRYDKNERYQVQEPFRSAPKPNGKESVGNRFSGGQVERCAQ